MEISEIKDRDSFREWLDDKPLEWAQALAARTALRVAPFAFLEANQRDDLDNTSREVWLNLLTFRACFISSVARNCPTEDMRASASAASRSASTASRFASASRLASASAAAAVAASASASAAVASASSVASRLASASSDIWSSIRVDCAFLQDISQDGVLAEISEDKLSAAAINAKALMQQPLWPGMAPPDALPDWAKNEFEKFANSELAQTTSFGLIIDWYQALVPMRPGNARSAFGEKADLAIANMSREDWGDDDEELDAVEVMDRVAELAGWERGGGKAKTGDLPSAKDLPPELPTQSIGTRFQLRENKISVARSSPDGTDWNRVSSLQPLIVDLATAASEYFNRNNCPHEKVAKILNEYLAEVDKPAGELDFTRLAGLGIRIANAEKAAQREIADRLKPDFEDEEKESLSSLLDLHGPFVLSSHDGQDLLADVQTWNRRPEEEEKFRRDALELADKLDEASDLADPQVGIEIRNAGTEIGSGPHPERASSFGFSVVKNSLTVVAGSGALYLAGAGISSGILPLQALSVFAVLFANDAVRKTEWFQAMSDAAAGKLDRIQKLKREDIDAIRKQAGKKFYDFILKNEQLLRDLAGERREFSWVHKVIDWIKNNDEISR